jgi:lipoprotein signal peptidase
LVLALLCFTPTPTTLLAVGVGLHVGGASSNLVDRIVSGQVTGLIVAGPVVINIADVALSLGTAIATSEPIRIATDPDATVPKEVRPR